MKENNETLTIGGINQKRNEEFEAKKHQCFIENMEGKASTSLSVVELSYLYKEHRKTYDRITQNKGEVVRDISLLDRLAKNKKKSEASFEEQKAKLKAEFEAEASLEGTEKPQPQQTFKLSDKAMEDMINRSIEKAMKGFKF